MSVVSCQFDMQGRGADKPLTVGDAFLLSCDGEVNPPLKQPAHITFTDEKDTYTIVALKVKESTSQNFKLIVTSYKPGEYSGQKLNITDGTTTVTTSDLNWKVNSILNPQEKPTPAPSEGPFFISYPLWLWLTLAAVALAISSLVLYVIYRRKKRQKLLAELEGFKTMLPPFSQFSRDMRTTQRQITQMKNDSEAAELVKKLDKDFRLYLIRELVVPALQVSDREVVREIRRGHRRVYDEYNADLRRILSEFSKAMKDLARVKAKDCEDLSFLSRQTAEKIYSVKRKSK